MIRHLLTAALAGLSFVALPALQAASQFEIRLLAFDPELQTEEAFAHDPAGDENAAPVATPIKGFLNHEFFTVPLAGRKIVFTANKNRTSLKNPEDLIAEVTLPANVTSALLLFLPPNPGAKAKSQIMVIDDSRRAFPPGSFHMTNLSPVPIRLMLEQKTFEFAPGKTTLIQDIPTRENSMTGMRAWALKDKQWKPVATSLWPHPGDRRSVIVAFQDPESGYIHFRAFDDVRPRTPQSTAAAGGSR